MSSRDHNKSPNQLSTVSSPPANRNRTPLDSLLIKWARTVLIRGSAKDASRAGSEFRLPRFLVFRAICDVLEMDGRVMEAVAYFREMENELAGDMRLPDERAQWERGFQQRCSDRLGKLGDAAMDSGNYNEAVGHFSATLSLDPVDCVDILLKRSKARTLMDSWEEALEDADEAIKLDPSCYRCYEMKHEILHTAGRYAEAVEAFQTMLSKIEASSDEGTRNIRSRYVDARPQIRSIVDQIIHAMPRMLIDTITGRLYDRQQQVAAFETLQIYSELVSSMTRGLDHARIREEAEKFYRYVMLSHKWENGEPLFHEVKNVSIYDLEASHASTKLQSFSSLARSLGFWWAWTDSSCIDKENNDVLHESLVAMFAWYRGSSLVVVHLLGVSSESQEPGDLRRCIWNTRAWAGQEYAAAEVIQFYTEDWKPYLSLEMFNHKESPAILAEMEQAMGISPQKLAILRPGLDRVREKLNLVSTRETTFVEDMAYSLFGIFNASIPVIYGEGSRAVGRLLEHILAGSGDVSILAWTGRAGGYNSCLPGDLTVYSQVVPPHVPGPVEASRMNRILAELRSASSDVSLAMPLYNSLRRLPPPFIVASRLRLSGIVFPLVDLIETPELCSGTNETKYHGYRATTTMLGEVEIKTTDDLSRMEDLCFVHPWIGPLFSQESAHDAATLDDATKALRLVARLEQPFGALLFAPLLRTEYKRIATDALIMVRIREGASLAALIDSIGTINIL